MRTPTSQEIEELVSFLPRLYSDGFKPIKNWHGGVRREDGVMTMPWPEYDQIVMEFVQAVSKDCWLDRNYRPEEAHRMLEEEFVKNANLDQIRSMLTYFVRGERFSDGHWGAMVQNGDISRLLQRLAELEIAGN